ncbi:MAG: hypothetical protein ABW098_07240 [Candidatus Thiodiazotropha sp.]
MRDALCHMEERNSKFAAI